MTATHIKAIGYFLTTYEADLLYIRNFQRHRQKKISPSEFTTKQDGMFYKFLIEFRVTRNFEKDKSTEILKLTNFWLDRKSGKDIDSFAEMLKTRGLTRNKTMTSLASKILFLNNPWEVFPMDNQAKKTLEHRTDNLFENYLPKVMKFKTEQSEIIKSVLTMLNPYCTVVEKQFKNELYNIKLIRENRFIDKLLWTIGQ